MRGGAHEPAELQKIGSFIVGWSDGRTASSTGTYKLNEYNGKDYWKYWTISGLTQLELILQPFLHEEVNHMEESIKLVNLMIWDTLLILKAKGFIRDENKITFDEVQWCLVECNRLCAITVVSSTMRQYKYPFMPDTVSGIGSGSTSVVASNDTADSTTVKK